MTAARPPLMPLDDALAALLAHARPLARTDTVATFDADHRVLAQDVVSALHVPPWDNSAMDGYALRSADAPAPGATLAVSQRIAAGEAGQPLAAGTAARIFTGAPIPEGADAVVMQEECEALDGGARVRVNAAPRPGQSIRRAGEDVARGATVLRQGRRLTPAALGLAASIGVATLDVAARPRVALFSTGDELVMPGDVAPEHMRPGAIYNSNRFVLRALLTRLGCEVRDFGIVPDRRDATEAALREAAVGCDLIITSGGVSVGEEDHLRPAVQALGRLDLWQIAIKPGKPFAYGSIDGAERPTHFIGLPGNPVAGFVTLLVLVRPFLLALQGVRDADVPATLLPAHFDGPRADKRREFLRARRNTQGGLDLFPNQGSGVLASAVWSDGLVDNPTGRAIARGDLVRFLPFAELLG
ncbi:molybdopterin molybdotransferase MoeA [Ramlibacter sp. H39-3-26]|uniref:molybdopterin molybdotransferase MoeA n=1 Tax=Curvibacter soli TaxID=3031331 RepID=UPI0023DC97A0|nr:gephyrin-like molybdotransferase Glp [Ramlibacter sp. H39-3-26]MDF1484284.1 molybdopterin molybdotransferase MoeA [Ramlibacter sp. H39-3-26]